MINGRETFGYNLYIDCEESRNTHKCADRLWSYMHRIYGSRLCSLSSNTTIRIGRETTSRGYRWETYRVWR